MGDPVTEDPRWETNPMNLDEDGLRLEYMEFYELLSYARSLEAALERIGHLTDGQEGRTMQTMAMHGFSPVKALEEARNIALTALSPPTSETLKDPKEPT